MLHLWMPEADGDWHWSVGGEWQIAHTLEQLIQSVQPYQGKECTVFFPSRYIQLIEQNLQKSQYQKLGSKGVGYLLEEFTVLPIESMQIQHHFQSPNHLTILGIAKNQLELIQNTLKLFPLNITALLPDFLILPEPQDQEIVIGEISGRLLMRKGLYMGNSVDDLALFLDFQKPEQNYAVMGLSEHHLESLTASVASEHMSVLERQMPTAKHLYRHPFNVLQKQKKLQGSSNYWLACAALLLAIVLVQLSYDGLNWYHAKKQADDHAQQALTQYQQWFGENARLTEQNLKSQFESQLRLNQQADTQALQILSRVGPLLMQQQVTAQRVAYEDSILSLELKANSSQILQNLTQQLNEQGFQVELGNIQPNEQGVLGLLKIKS